MATPRVLFENAVVVLVFFNVGSVGGFGARDAVVRFDYPSH